MAVAVTPKRLLTLKIGTPIGLGIGGEVKELLSAVPISEVESIDVKRLLLGYKIKLNVRGSEIVLESNAASGARALPEALDAARGVAA
jgi:hypothetical protein